MKNNLNIFEELSDTEIKQLNKLDIKIENKEYTREEYEILKVKFCLYFCKGIDEKEMQDIKKDLKTTGINTREYKKLIKVFEKIENKFQ